MSGTLAITSSRMAHLSIGDGHLGQLPPLADRTRLASYSEEPTLADAVRIAEASGQFHAKQLAAMRNDAARFARMVGKEMDAIPISPLRLRPIVARILPTGHGIGRKRFRNIKAHLVTLAIAAGVHDTREELTVPLVSPWADLHLALGRRHDKARLVVFMRWAQRNGIAPCQVDEAAVERFRTWRTERTLLLEVPDAIRGLRQTWNRAIGRIPGWPARVLAGRIDPRRIALPPSAFPDSFNRDVRQLLKALGGEGANTRLRSTTMALGRRKTHSVVTVNEYRRLAYRAASVLVRHGRDPMSITSVGDIANAEAIAIVMNDLLERSGGIWPAHAETLMAAFLVIARDYLKLPPDQVELLVADRRHFREERKRTLGDQVQGLSERNAGRLAQFDAPGMLQAFFLLPERVFEAAIRLAKEAPVRAAQLHETALALAILQAKPMRRRNLAQLDIVRHFQRSPDGALLRIYIPGAETKNGRALDFLVDETLGKVIDRHIRKFRPHLPGGSTNWLFGSITGKHRDPSNLGKAVTKLVETQLGVHYNLHLVRHIMATAMLDAAPESAAAVQRVLDHSSPQTIERAYGSKRSRGAHLAWYELIDTVRRGGTDPNAVRSAGNGTRGI
jgi:hypothetical protein